MFQQTDDVPFMYIKRATNKESDFIHNRATDITYAITDKYILPLLSTMLIGKKMRAGSESVILYSWSSHRV